MATDLTGLLIHDSAQIHPNALIGPRTRIEANVVIGESVIIGADCTICSGAVIGALPDQNPEQEYFGIEIGKSTFVGCNSTIQYGIVRVTKIGEKCWINHGCGVGHDVMMGDEVRLGLSSTISGHSLVGNGVIIGPGCTLTNRSEIGDSAIVGIGSLVLHPVKRGSTVMGRPAEPRDQYLKSTRRLREMLETQRPNSRITGSDRVISRKNRLLRIIIPSHKLRKWLKLIIRKFKSPQ